MKSRPGDVAQLAGMLIEQVISVSNSDVRFFYTGRIPDDVLEVACSGLSELGEPCFYWRVGNVCYLDDATFGPVVAIDDLHYDSKTGLSDRR